MRKLFPVLLLVVALAGTIAASGAVALAQAEQPQRGGRLELVALNDLATLDNTQALDLDYNMVAGALYEGLYHFDPQGELEPGLADGLPEVSEDGLVYTFRIKPGAMFAGPDFEPREVTAADVAYGMLRGLDPTPIGAPIQGWGASYLFPIKGAAAFAAGEAETVEGIEVIDDHTLQVTLEQPTSTFLLGLTIATSWPVPQEAVEERGEDFANRPVGAGPFFVAGVEQGLRHHHRAQPRLRGPGAALPGRDPRRPRRRREHAGPAPRVGRGRRRLRAVRHLAPRPAPAAAEPVTSRSSIRSARASSTWPSTTRASWPARTCARPSPRP